MPLLTVFQSYQGKSSHYSCLSWVSPGLGWDSEVSCPKTLPRKNPEDPVRLEPRTPGLRVKHFTTEPPRTSRKVVDGFEKKAVFVHVLVWESQETHMRHQPP